MGLINRRKQIDEHTVLGEVQGLVPTARIPYLDRLETG